MDVGLFSVDKIFFLQIYDVDGPPSELGRHRIIYECRWKIRTISSAISKQNKSIHRSSYLDSIILIDVTTQSAVSVHLTIFRIAMLLTIETLHIIEGRVDYIP